MNKQIIHYGQDPDKSEFYIIRVKVSSISSSTEYKILKSKLLNLGFRVYEINSNIIEASFKNRYLEAADKLREIDKLGWKFGDKPGIIE